MRLRKTDYEAICNSLAHAGAMMVYTSLNQDGCPYDSMKAAERDASWFDRQKLPHPSATPTDTKNLRPLLVGLMRLILFGESPTELEREIDDARDGGLPAAMSLCELRDRITRHLREARQ